MTESALKTAITLCMLTRNEEDRVSVSLGFNCMYPVGPSAPAAIHQYHSCSGYRPRTQSQ